MEKETNKKTLRGGLNLRTSPLYYLAGIVEQRVCRVRLMHIDEQRPCFATLEVEGRG